LIKDVLNEYIKYKIRPN